MLSGHAVSVEGGYRVSGRWSFACGIRHSQWLSAGALVVDEGGEVVERLSIVFPTKEAVIHDNWRVAGL